MVSGTDVPLETRIRLHSLIRGRRIASCEVSRRNSPPPLREQVRPEIKGLKRQQSRMETGVEQGDTLYSLTMLEQ